MPAAEKNPGRAGWLFGAVTVLPALLAVAWLLPAFPLLLAGRLSPPPMIFMFVPLAAALCYFAVRQLPATWPAFGETRPSSAEAKAAEAKAAEAKPTEPSTGEADATETETRATEAGATQAKAKEASQPASAPVSPATATAPWWALAATVAIAVAFTVWQLAERTEQIIYLRDPATYLQV